MKSYREVAESVLDRRDAYMEMQKKRRKTAKRMAVGAVGLCTAALLGVLAWQGRANVYGNDNLATGGTIPDTGSNPNGSGTDSNGFDGNDSAFPGGSSMQPVSYSSLKFPQGEVRPEIIQQYRGDSASMAEILPFDESLLSKCCAIFEGEITDMYLKEYTYDTYDDKFGEKELYHNKASSVVYELSAEKVWYGDGTLSGTSVLIEDDTYLMDSYFSLKVGGRYVIPVRDAGETKWVWKEYAGGDLTRDSRYTSLYPHHPQIEVTEDGDYVVTADWETLCSGNARDIVMEPVEDTFVEYHPENEATEEGLITTEWRTLLVPAWEAMHFYDQMKLIDGGEFFIQLTKLVDGLTE